MYSIISTINWCRLTQLLIDLLGTRYVFSRTAPADVGIAAEYLADGTRSDTGEITVDHPLAGTLTIRDSALNRLDVRFRV